MSTHVSLQVTPPKSFTSGSPLSPPPTGEKATNIVKGILTELKARQRGRGRSTEPWSGYTLKKGQYGELLREIQSDETLLGYVTHKLRQYTGAGSPTLTFSDPGCSKHDPDAQFRHLSAKYPGVVIEVSYTQKRKDLTDITEEYILGSDGDIRVVIGIDVEYCGSKKATLSVWRPGIERNEEGEAELVAEQTVVDQTIRDEKGDANNNPGAGLYLQLQDFATEELVGSNVFDDPISIPASRLCAFIDEAEQNVTRQNQATTSATKPWVRKRWRQRTPPEELDEEREAKFRKIEERTIAKEEGDDVSYRPSDGE